VSELADAKQISRAAVSQAMNALVEKGLVSRRRNPQDRRHVELTLTDAGERLLDAVFEDTRQWMMQLLSPLNAEELEALRQGLDSLRKIEAG
jgi:DNA-binding MarR family transcriptional regulator